MLKVVDGRLVSVVFTYGLTIREPACFLVTVYETDQPLTVNREEFQAEILPDGRIYRAELRVGDKMVPTFLNLEQRRRAYRAIDAYEEHHKNDFGYVRMWHPQVSY